MEYLQLMSRVTEAEVTAADEEDNDDAQKGEGFVIVAVLEKEGEKAWLEWESEEEERDVMLELVEVGDANVIPADVVVNAWHSRTELTSARDKFFKNSSFSTTNPNERSFIVTNVSSITNEDEELEEEKDWTELCLIHITDGAGRPVWVIHDHHHYENIKKVVLSTVIILCRPFVVGTFLSRKRVEKQKEREVWREKKS